MAEYVDDYGIEDVDAYLNARGSTNERLQRAVENFNNIAQTGDEHAARTILAQLENLDPNDETVRDNLDENKVKIVQEAVAGIRRGTGLDLLLTALASVAGMTAGYYTQKFVDVRLGPVAPIPAVAGAIGIGVGAVGNGKILDMHLTLRNALTTGGSTFAVGAGLYMLSNPRADRGPADIMAGPGVTD